MQLSRDFHEQQGSGLGLIIAKTIVEWYLGNLSVESVPQQETTIKITLPANEIKPEIFLLKIICCRNPESSSFLNGLLPYIHTWDSSDFCNALDYLTNLQLLPVLSHIHLRYFLRNWSI